MGTALPIPTTYNGILMRSRLEAAWAAVMDHYEIEWLYEPEAFKLSDGTLYLPDFYLPRANMIFEVKGLMTDVDAHKIIMWMKDFNRPAAVGYPNGSFVACDHIGNKETGYWTFEDEGNVIFKHEKCGGVSFMAFGCGGWICPCCNEYAEYGHNLSEYQIENFSQFFPHYENKRWRK